MNEVQNLSEGGKSDLNVHSEGLELNKTTKGYTWKIKIKEINVDRIDGINEEMKDRYGDE